MKPTQAELAALFNLPPERAVEYLAAKGYRITWDWREMAAQAHARAFTVSGMLKLDGLAAIREALERALAEGKSYASFVKELVPELRKKGLWGRQVLLNPDTGELKDFGPWRLRTIFQTNLQSAYMAGRYRAQFENADARPFWQYIAVMDAVTRPSHAALNGRVFRYDDPIWRAIYPPNGYNCRCRVRALTADEMKAKGLHLSSSQGRLDEIEVPVSKLPGDTARVVRFEYAPGRYFAPDAGFSGGAGMDSFGADQALLRKLTLVQDRALRVQAVALLNGSPERQQAFAAWTDRVLTERRPGLEAQTIGFVSEGVADFARGMGAAEPVRLLALSAKRLVHADSLRHQVEGIALSAVEYRALPALVAAPDEVYWDTAYRNLVYVRRQRDGSVIYLALDVDANVKKLGRLDELVNVYRLPPGPDGAGRLETARYVRMGAR